MEKETNEINKEKLKSKAKKLKALADKGIGGEKETAAKMYKEFMEKHGLNDGDVDPSANNRKFKVKTEDDAFILTNVILSVNPFTKVVNNPTIIEAELDLEDFNEVKEKFRYFIKLYRVEKELLNMAFFSKHNDFFTPDEHAKSKWRDSNKENEELKKARERAEKLSKTKDETVKNSTSMEDLEKLKKNEQIQRLNQARFAKLAAILLEGKYVRTYQTIDKEK
jgi:hypothetical protein